MKLSVNHHSQYKQQADEIKCPYNQLGRIFDFINSNRDKRYVIVIKDLPNEVTHDKLLQQINFVKEIAPNYTVECGNIELMKNLIETGYNAYLRYPITDWETFTYLQRIGVSDIYIDGPLGFQCEALETGKSATIIRANPVLSVNSSLIKEDACSFFIRPEDLHLYESAIDIIDFSGVDNQDKMDTMFRIYQRGTFNFDIQELISISPKASNIVFTKEFAENRLNCGQKCKIPGRHCSSCNIQFTIINNLTKLAPQLNLEAN